MGRSVTVKLLCGQREDIPYVSSEELRSRMMITVWEQLIDNGTGTRSFREGTHHVNGQETNRQKQSYTLPRNRSAQTRSYDCGRTVPPSLNTIRRLYENDHRKQKRSKSYNMQPRNREVMRNLSMQQAQFSERHFGPSINRVAYFKAKL